MAFLSELCLSLGFPSCAQSSAFPHSHVLRLYRSDMSVLPRTIRKPHLLWCGVHRDQLVKVFCSPTESTWRPMPYPRVRMLVGKRVQGNRDLFQ